MSDYPSKLRELRLSLGLSQEQLAKRAGVTRITVRNAEAGRVSPNLATARALQHALGAQSLDIVFPDRSAAAV